MDITLKGDNTIDGSEAIDKVTEGGGHDISKDNVNIEGIRVGGEGASDSSDASEGANTKLTISGGVEKDRNCGNRHRRNGKLCGRFADHQ